MTEEEAIKRATVAIKKKHRRNLPVHSTEYFSIESLRHKTKTRLEERVLAGTLTEARAKELMEEEEKGLLSDLAKSGPYWVIRFDRCPPPGVVIDPSVHIVCVYEKTGKAVVEFDL